MLDTEVHNANYQVADRFKSSRCKCLLSLRAITTQTKQRSQQDILQQKTKLFLKQNQTKLVAKQLRELVLQAREGGSLRLAANQEESLLD